MMSQFDTSLRREQDLSGKPLFACKSQNRVSYSFWSKPQQLKLVLSAACHDQEDHTNRNLLRDIWIVKLQYSEISKANYLQAADVCI